MLCPGKIRKLRLFGTLCVAAVAMFAATAGAQTGHSPPQLGVDYTWEAGRNLRGGVRTGGFQLGNLDLQAQFDASSLGELFSGTTVFLYGLGNHGSDPTALTGDAQVFTNIAAPRAFRLFEGWIEKTFANGRASMLLGLYDLNTEFDAVQSSGLFLNSSFGIGVDFSQSGGNGPSIFPVTSLALRLRTAHGNKVYTQVVALDGVPGYPDHPSHQHVVLSRKDGALIAAEVGLVESEDGVAVSRTQEGSYTFRASVGAWIYSAEGEAILTGEPRRNRGAYGAVDALVYSEAASPEQGLFLFARAGVADASVNRFGLYVGTGAVYTGAIPGRDEDQLGLAIATAVNGSAYKRVQQDDGVPVSSAESSIELTYFAQLLSWMSLQLDSQYILNPDTSPLLKHALTGSARLVFSFRPEL